MNLQPIELEAVAPVRNAKIDAFRVRMCSPAHDERLAASRIFRVSEGQSACGYASFLPQLGSDPSIRNRLVEFEISNPWRRRAENYLTSVTQELEVEQIEVRTDDAVTFEIASSFASRFGWNSRPVGAIYALETGVLHRPAPPDGASVRLLKTEDLEAAFALSRNAESRTRLAVDEKRVWGVFRGEEIVGTAEVLRLPYHRYADLRPVIQDAARRGGYATYLIAEVSRALLTTNYRLTTEAEPAARVWRHIAEKLGLTLAAHRLLLSRT